MTMDCLKIGPTKQESARSQMIRFLVIFITLPLHSSGTVCFRRARQENGVPVCRGRIHSPFSSPQDCCHDNRAAAFAHNLSRIPGRRFRFPCVPCHALHALEAVQDVMTLRSTSMPEPTSPTVPVETTPDQTVWGHWSDWSSCSITCGAGLHIRQRHCTVDDVTLCKGPSRQGRPCQLLQYCPVHGNWGPWFPWTPCSASCGPGTKFRERLCADPPQALGGRHCEGQNQETKTCYSSNCPTDGEWGEWSPWSDCNATCGRGRRMRFRRCDKPRRQNGGKKCKGRRRQRERCSLPQCPVDGGWTLWSKWSQCSATCGEGISTRGRQCVSPTPVNGGANCTGRSEQHRKCMAEKKHCPIDGGWSSWGEWLSCDATPCSNVPGFRQRLRVCEDPLPQHGGSYCDGARFESSPCYSYSEDCPETGVWCQWATWGECEFFKDRLVRERRRKCQCPAPQNGGQYCQGPSFEEEEHCSKRARITSVEPRAADRGHSKCNSASGSGPDSDDSDAECDQEVEDRSTSGVTTQSHDQPGQVTPT